MAKQDANNYWEQLERLEKLIRASELKAGVIFSFHSLILGLFFDRLDQFKDMFVEYNTLLVLSLSWFVFVAVSLFFCFKCFNPTLEMSYDSNVFFFRDAAKKFGTTEEYVEALLHICGSEEKFYKALAEQIHAESKIIDAKFKNVRRSILFFAISFFCVFLIAVFWLFYT